MPFRPFYYSLNTIGSADGSGLSSEEKHWIEVIATRQVQSMLKHSEMLSERLS